MIYVYAIADEQVEAAAPGVEERPVEAVRHGDLTAFVSAGLRSAVDPEPGALREHEHVVASLMNASALLPMRFGSLVSDDAALRAFLDARGPELERSLERVRDRVELGVRALWPSARGRPEPRTGAEFMRARLARRQAAGRVADAVHPPLVELAADAKFSLLPRDDTPFTAAYLVDRGCLLEFERRVESLRGTHEDVELVFSGPWPPYSFSELGDA